MSKVLSLDHKLKQEKDREKENVGGRPAKLKRATDRDLEREIKRKRTFFFVGRTTRIFVMAVRK